MKRQNYQIQMMMLERQNKRRLMVLSQEQGGDQASEADLPVTDEEDKEEYYSDFDDEVDEESDGQSTSRPSKIACQRNAIERNDYSRVSEGAQSNVKAAVSGRHVLELGAKILN